MITYELTRTSSDGEAIHCLLCGRVSGNPGDVRNRYCDRCKVFHGDRQSLAYHFFAEGILTLRPDLDAGERTRLLEQLAETCSPAVTPHGAEPQWGLGKGGGG